MQNLSSRYLSRSLQLFFSPHTHSVCRKHWSFRRAKARILGIKSLCFRGLKIYLSYHWSQKIVTKYFLGFCLKFLDFSELFWKSVDTLSYVYRT
ncbi:hypothetical protein HOLleu_44030 [Holothuria leucospilota]|uniref:Uncharacterized protein n=1 Tax=Holothuria leucospilota TaxID=206669 RepID=A0A9Q0Y933_HOLLE|nr:hypothetical protein HOLleu_44030 [Holothuria leucospilota]